MAYVYYIPPPPPPLPPAPERPSLCSPTRSSGFICGPVLIFLGGASALMVGFFERKPAIIWPIISCGAALCALGVFLARRHVQHWRAAEQERQRAMWRTNRPQANDQRRSGDDGGGGGGGNNTGLDVPMYCLEAPSRPLVRPSSERPAGPFQKGAAAGDVTGGRDGTAGQQYDGEYWCALAVPLKPDDVNNSEYLNWAAMTLVVQPHFKFGSRAPSPAAATDAGGYDTAEASPVALTRTLPRANTDTGFTRGGDHSAGGGGGEGPMEHASEPTLAAVSLSLMRSPSWVTRSAYDSQHSAGGGVGSERRMGRGSRTGRMGDLLSLFVAVAGNGGGGGARGGDEAAGGGALPPEVDANGVQLAGLKAMAVQATTAAGRRSPSPLVPAPPPPMTPVLPVAAPPPPVMPPPPVEAAPPPIMAPPPPMAAALATGPPECSTEYLQQRSLSPGGGGGDASTPASAGDRVGCGESGGRGP